jgi:hypothetical protein
VQVLIEGHEALGVTECLQYLVLHIRLDAIPAQIASNAQ